MERRDSRHGRTRTFPRLWIKLSLKEEISQITEMITPFYHCSSTLIPPALSTENHLKSSVWQHGSELSKTSPNTESSLSRFPSTHLNIQPHIHLHLHFQLIHSTRATRRKAESLLSGASTSLQRGDNSHHISQCVTPLRNLWPACRL